MNPNDAAPLPAGTVPSHLVWAILSTLFCCMPLGIVSIVKAAEVNGRLAAGDLEGARASSAAARKWAMWSAGVLLGLVAIYILLALVLAATGNI